MAKRPIFVISLHGPAFVTTHYIEFRWYPGMAVTQAQRSIDALHEAARAQLHLDEILEVSTKSKNAHGVAASAFNLTILTPKKREFSVECAYQSSKVFEHGGPYVDLLLKDSRNAKTDPRLSDSGRLLAFKFFGQEWKLEPKTAFYDWLYINALDRQPTLADTLLRYEAFSDIAFNPERSLNCQAHAAALYVSLYKRGMLRDVLSDRSAYLEAVKGTGDGKGRREAQLQNPILFD